MNTEEILKAIQTLDAAGLDTRSISAEFQQRCEELQPEQPAEYPNPHGIPPSQIDHANH